MRFKFSLENHRPQASIAQAVLEAMLLIAPEEHVEVFRCGHNELIEAESKYWDLYLENRKRLLVNQRRFDDMNRYAGEWTMLELVFK